MQIRRNVEIWTIAKLSGSEIATSKSRGRKGRPNKIGNAQADYSFFLIVLVLRLDSNPFLGAGWIGRVGGVSWDEGGFVANKEA